MTSGRRILIGGGTRSGKSAFALRLARRLGERRVYVATAEAGDEEMAGRIARHAKERGKDFHTLESPLDVVDALGSIEEADVVVLDCLTFWTANLLMRGRSEQEILNDVSRLEETVRGKPYHFVVVTNEVGMGVVPESSLGRAFRDVVGRAHQTIAARADEIYFGALGLMLRLKPDPLVVITEGDR